MIRKILCFCLLIAAGCGDGNEVPAGILSEDKMTGILMDVYVTEAELNSYQPRLPRDSSEIVFTVLKQDIYEKYNTNDSTFKESMSWYFERPERLERIYSRLTDSLNLKVQKFKEPERDE
jgi:hypothetical protein